MMPNIINKHPVEFFPNKDVNFLKNRRRQPVHREFIMNAQEQSQLAENVARKTNAEFEAAVEPHEPGAEVGRGNLHDESRTGCSHTLYSDGDLNHT